jgi:ribosome-associated protein
LSDKDQITPLPNGIGQRAITLEFVRSRGAGGQNVNKVSSAVVLRVNVQATDLTKAVQARLLKLAGARATKAGEVVIKADRLRTQARNRADAFERLTELVTQARHVPKHRRPTKVKVSAKKRRLDQKGRRGSLKKLRGLPPSD